MTRVQAQGGSISAMCQSERKESERGISEWREGRLDRQITRGPIAPADALRHTRIATFIAEKAIRV